jgi:hypothetical protein
MLPYLHPFFDILSTNTIKMYVFYKHIPFGDYLRAPVAHSFIGKFVLDKGKPVSVAVIHE